jgi:hypothetical protein
MQPPSVTVYQKQYWLFLIGLAVILIVLGGAATSRYGAGVASDSVNYLSVAQNLASDKGLIDYLGSHLILWPPLYPLLLAGLKLITGLDVFVTAWYLNLFLLGLNLCLGGILFWRVFSKFPLYAYLSTLFVFLSLSSLRLHDMIGSDALYLTITLAFLLATDEYIHQHSTRSFVSMIMLSTLAPLQRYIGLAVTVTALLVILIEHRKSLQTMIRSGVVLGLVSIMPIFWWLILRNLLTFGSLFGTNGNQTIDIRQNIDLALTKMLHWFAPYLSFLMPLLTRPWLVLGAIGLILILINIQSRQNWSAWIRALMSRSTYPMMLYTLVYFSALAVTVVTSDHRFLFSDRYYVILLVPTIILVWLTYEHLIKPHLRFSEHYLNYGLIAAFILWSVYPLYSLREYTANALQQGEPSEYNLFNTRAYHEMKVVTAIQRLREQQPNALVYSNYTEAVWFFTRKPVQPSLTDNVSDKEIYSGWPQGNSGYLVWFKPNEYKHYLPPEKLAGFAKLDLIYSDPSGDIYYVQAR